MTTPTFVDPDAGQFFPGPRSRAPEGRKKLCVNSLIPLVVFPRLHPRRQP